MNAFNVLEDMGSDDDRKLDQELESLTLQSSGGSEKEEDSVGQLFESLIWIDLEMTGTWMMIRSRIGWVLVSVKTITFKNSGLDVTRDSILQIAVIVTDGALSRVIEGEEIAIHHSDEVLSSMNDWCKEHHGKSGLVEQVQKSTVTMGMAEERVMGFIEKFAEKNSPIAGNSVHVDVQFLKRHMPRITDYCHYRIVDVSTIGELCKRWYKKEFRQEKKKKLAHTAMSDIRESIEQLKYYRETIFKPKRKK